MNRRSMFPRLVLRSLFERRRRLAAAVAALAVGAALASALLTTYADLEGKMAGELRGFGANLIVAPRPGPSAASEETLDERSILRVIEHPALPVLYVVGRTNEAPSVLAGTDFTAFAPFARAWKWQGGAPQGAQECALGERLAALLHLSPGSRVKIAVEGREAQLTVTGIVATGASEDHQLHLPLATLQQLARLDGRASVIQIIAPASGAALEAQRQRIASAAGPGVEVRTLRAVAESSARVLLRVKWLLFAVTAVVLGVLALAVMTTLSAMVLERRRDIAVMKALGGTDRTVGALLLSESALLSLAGTAAGYILGTLAAMHLARAVFQSPVTARPSVLPEVLLVTMAVALAGTLVPLRIVRRLQPAAILKGE